MVWEVVWSNVVGSGVVWCGGVWYGTWCGVVDGVVW